MADAVMDTASPRHAARNLTINAGDSIQLVFSRTATASGHSVNFFLGDAIALHVIVRAQEHQLVANDRRGERWGAECVLDIPPGGLAAGLAVSVTFSEQGISLGIPGAPALEIEGRFIVLGAVRVEFTPSIALRGPSQAAPASERPALAPSIPEPVLAGSPPDLTSPHRVVREEF